MKWKLLADSGCEVKTLGNLAPDCTYQYIPLKIRIGEEEITDDAQLDVSQLMDKMSRYSGKSSTSCPSVGEWAAAMEDGDNIIAVTISSKLSGSYNACIAAQKMVLAEHPEKKICVIDSLLAGTPLAMLVYKINEYIAKNLSFEEICQKAKDYLSHLKILYVLESMDNLVKNGRVSKWQSTMAGLLNIRIIGADDNGQIHLLHKCRGAQKTLATVVGEMGKNGFEKGKVLISHCLNSKTAEQLQSLILKAFPQADIRIIPTNGLCGFYAERGGMIIGYEDK